MTTSRIIRTSQPQGTVGIDWANPITNGIYFVGLPTSGVNLASGRLVQLSGALSTTRGLAVGGVSGSLVSSDNGVGSIKNEHSSLVLGNRCTATNNTNDRWLLNFGGYSGIIQEPYSAGLGIRFKTYYNSSEGTSTGLVHSAMSSLNTPYVIAMSFKRSSVSNGWINGVKRWEVSTLNSPGTSYGSPSLLGAVSLDRQLAVCWDRALSDTEIITISSNPWQIFKPIKTPIFVGTSAAVQLLSTLGRPVADIAMGAWAPSAGTTLYECIDEVVPEDSDYIYTNTASVCEIQLDATAFPGAATQAISYRASSDKDSTLVVRLIQNSVTIATWEHQLTSVDTLYTQSLTTGEINSLVSGPISIQLETL